MTSDNEIQVWDEWVFHLKVDEVLLQKALDKIDKLREEMDECQQMIDNSVTMVRLKKTF